MKPLCNYFGYLFLSYCLVDKPSVAVDRQIGRSSRNVPKSSNFELEYQWQFVNFTWPSSEVYHHAVDNQDYIPANVNFAASKPYKGRLYMCLPQIRKGVPFSLATIPIDSGPKFNALLEPYPSWEKSWVNTRDCVNLKSVQSFEIDENGVMWALDGVRINSNTNCPPKLVLLDLNDSGKIILSHIFSKDVALSRGAFLNDIVLDSSDGGYAYITDASSIDPGLIVYSRKQNRAWKLRDSTMFVDNSATKFLIGNETVTFKGPIDGLAMSPKHSQTGYRMVFYCAVSGFNLYGISTKYLKNYELYENGNWRELVKNFGKKQSQTDGMMADAKGNLYYTLLPLNGIAKWNINKSFNTSQVIFSDKDALWTDSLSIDNDGYLRLLTNNYQQIGIYTGPLQVTSEVRIRIFKGNIGSKSYLYN